MLSLPEFKEKTIVIVFATEGQKFSFLNDNVVVKNMDDVITLQTTCHRMLALWIVGNGTFTTGLLERSKKFGFPIAHLSQNLKLTGIWNAPTEGNFLLRKKQYHYEGLTIAKHLIVNKVNNQLATLKAIRQKSETCINTVSMVFLSACRLPFIFDGSARSNMAWMMTKRRIRTDVMRLAPSWCAVGMTLIRRDRSTLRLRLTCAHVAC